MERSDAIPRLNLLERIGLAWLVLALVAFGIVVELRSALQKHRRTDFGVYARAAWAAREGSDPYAIEDDRGWHYCYPPPFAVAMAPFADPPKGEPRTFHLPFAVSVAIWYLIGIACIAFAIDRFARILLPDEPRRSRRWWYARTGPFLIAIGAIGHTLARGQVNLLVVALLAAAYDALARRRSYAAGAWIGAAACIKVLPAFLVLHFLTTRDRRGLLGFAAALVFGLVVVPSLVWGPRAAIDLNRRFVQSVLHPGATGDGDSTRGWELTNATATDSQSFQSVIHNWIHADRHSRPVDASRETRLAHWLVGGLVAFAILLGVRLLESNPANDLIRMGALGVSMLHLSPVSHMHYYAYALPLVCGVWLKALRDRPDRAAPVGMPLAALLVWSALTTLPLFDAPLAETLRSHGGGLAASYVLLRAGLARPIQSRISTGWPSRSPRTSASAAMLTRSAP
jgi:alpha-1,2-mannosyltransferase